MNMPEEDIETIHVYVYDQPPKPWFRLPKMPAHFADRCIQIIALFYLAAFCLLPASPMYTISILIVPSIPLTTQVFQVTIPIQESGVNIIPATNAHGILTLYNGLSVSQSLPVSFILSTTQKIEVATDNAVAIPPGTIAGYGVATVSAHALNPGSQGNIQAGAIDTVYGASLYIKNMAAFTGGHDQRTEHYITQDDITTALQAAQEQLHTEQLVTKHPGLAVLPCQETEKQASQSLSLTWTCQDVTYKAPVNAQVLSAQVIGKRILLRVKVVVAPH